MVRRPFGSLGGSHDQSPSREEIRPATGDARRLHVFRHAAGAVLELDPLLMPEIATHLMVPGQTLPENSPDLQRARLHDNPEGAGGDPTQLWCRSEFRAPNLYIRAGPPSATPGNDAPRLQGGRIRKAEGGLAAIGEATRDKKGNIIAGRVTSCRLDEILQEYAMAIGDRPLNPRSTLQLASSLYQHLHLPETMDLSEGASASSP